MDFKPYLDFVTKMTYHAGRITLGYFNVGVRSDYKDDDTPVTAADRAAENFIREELGKVYPNHAILGEEYGETGIKGSSFRWIIDPIDGTKSYIRGVPLYAVLVGLEIDGIVRVGAAYYPGTDEMLCAADREGTWWNGRRTHVSNVDSMNRAWVCYTDSRNMGKYGRKEAWERVNSSAYSVRGWGDAYGYLAVATGRAEAMFDPIMATWDCGPFPVIFKEAGGFFGSWDGREGHLHNEALACNSILLPEILRLING